MKKRKIFIVTLVLIVLSLSTISQAYATTNSSEPTQNISSNLQEIPIYDEDEAKEILYGDGFDNDATKARLSVLTHKVGVMLARSGNTKKVLVYLIYTSPYYKANAIKMSSLKIKTTTKKTTYKSFGKFTKTFPAGTSRYIYLGNTSIGKTVKKAYVSGTGVYTYTLKKGWLSVSNIIGNATIQ